MPRHHWLLIMNETFAIKTWGRKAIQFLKSFYLSTIIRFTAFTFSAETAYHALWFLYSVLILLLIEPSKETSSSCSLFLAFIIFFAKTLAQPTHFLLFGIKTKQLLCGLCLRRNFSDTLALISGYNSITISINLDDSQRSPSARLSKIPTFPWCLTAKACFGRAVKMGQEQMSVGRGRGGKTSKPGSLIFVSFETSRKHLLRTLTYDRSRNVIVKLGLITPVKSHQNHVHTLINIWYLELNFDPLRKRFYQYDRERERLDYFDVISGPHFLLGFLNTLFFLNIRM